MEHRIPIGIMIYVSGYNQPFIYFDEVEGPYIFPYFCENMFYHCLNWVDINIGPYNEVMFMRDTIENAKDEAHRFLTHIIIEAQDRQYDLLFPQDI